MFSLLSILCTLLYLLATGYITSRLFHSEGPNSRMSRAIACVAIALHAGILYNDIISDATGQNLSITNVASIVAWLIALSMTLLSFKQNHVFLTPVVYGFTSFAVLLNTLLPATYVMHIELQPTLLIHITLALFAYGSLMIAVLYALQVSYINHKLKSKQLALLHSSLPPLMDVETTLFKILLYGTVLLSLSLFSGFIFLDDMFAQKQVHKTILSIVAWILYTGTLVAHYQFAWRGRGVVITTVIGATLLTIGYFGSRIVKEVILT